MKKILVSSIFASSLAFGALNTNTFVADELTGDTKLACEAILCLSTGTRPIECQPSIDRYFGIHYKKWSDTIKGRQNFLNLCPTGDDQNPTLNTLKNEVLANMQTDCTAGYLNTRIERKIVDKMGLKSQIPEYATNIYCEDQGENYSYYNSDPNCKWKETHMRVNPVMPGYCQALIDHEYTDKNLKYTCSGEFKPQNEFKKECWIEQ